MSHGGMKVSAPDKPKPKAKAVHTSGPGSQQQRLLPPPRQAMPSAKLRQDSTSPFSKPGPNCTPFGSAYAAGSIPCRIFHGSVRSFYDSCTPPPSSVPYAAPLLVLLLPTPPSPCALCCLKSIHTSQRERLIASACCDVYTSPTRLHPKQNTAIRICCPCLHYYRPRLPGEVQPVLCMPARYSLTIRRLR